MTALLVLAVTIPTGNLAIGFEFATVFYYLMGWIQFILNRRHALTL